MAEERKLATILFADLAGSTALADEQDPERTRARLERFYDAMADEIRAAGGTIEKFAGDAVMAAFGAPEALEDHAERALHAALSMQRRLEEGLALRVGLNTGEVVTGAAREGSSFVSGDAVNVAARLEQAAEPGEILAGARTVAAAGAAFEFGDERTVEAKGKPEGVPCRPVVRALSLMRPRGAGRAFVGRDGELERLLQAYRRSSERAAPVVVTVLGDAGVGKTRLMRELWARLEPEALRRTGRCLPYGEGITFWPLAEALKEHLGILESDPPEQVLRRLGDRQILGLTLGLDVAGDLHPLAARDKLHAAWVDFVTEQAAERPLVLLVEDVHWAEPPLLDLLERLARDVRGPLLLLATARPDFTRSWDARVDSETIVLEPLETDAAASLVEQLGAKLPSDVRELIVSRAEGNPFFAEELVQLAGENGSEIPDSVQAVLASRIDLLGEAEKAALQAAAVIGRAFWTSPMYELVGEHAPDLSVLEGRDFIRRRAASSLEGEVEYVFKHALTREVAYNGLTKARRARLHAGFAGWLERTGGGRDDHAPLLAHHYAEAVRPEDADVAWPQGGAEELRSKAIVWLARAAEGAMSRYELHDAVALLERALALEEDPAAGTRLWQRLGRAHALAYDGDSFLNAIERSLELADLPEERAEIYASLAYEGALRGGIWRNRPPIEEMDEWTRKALAGVQEGSEAHAKTLVARAFWGLGSAVEDARRATEIARALDLVDLECAALDGLGVAAFRAGDFERAHELETQRFGLLERITSPDVAHDVYISAIPTACATGRFDEARRLADELHDVVEDLTPHHRLHGVACRLEIAELAGEWEEIRGLEDVTRDAVAKNRDTPCVRDARSLLLCAIAHEIHGEPSAAAALEELAAEVESQGHGTVLETPRARLALLRGDLSGLPQVLSDKDWRVRQSWFALPTAATRLDVLAVLGNADVVETAARTLAPEGSYVEPFALRARAIAHDDDALLARAAERFAALRLDWHAEQTARLAELRKTARS